MYKLISDQPWSAGLKFPNCRVPVNALCQVSREQGWPEGKSFGGTAPVKEPRRLRAQLRSPRSQALPSPSMARASTPSVLSERPVGTHRGWFLLSVPDAAAVTRGPGTVSSTGG